MFLPTCNVSPNMQCFSQYTMFLLTCNVWLTGCSFPVVDGEIFMTREDDKGSDGLNGFEMVQLRALPNTDPSQPTSYIIEPVHCDIPGSASSYILHQTSPSQGTKVVKLATSAVPVRQLVNTQLVGNSQVQCFRFVFLKCLCNEKFNFLMRWISWWCRVFNYGKGKYCNPRSNINILIPKMSGVWDRIRSLVTSHVRVNLAFLIVFSFLIVYDSNVWRHRGNLTAWGGGQNLCNFVIFTLNIKYFVLP